MNIKIRKNASAIIYFGQVKGCLLINGRIIKPKTINHKIIINLLNSLSITINILIKKRKKRNILTNRLFLELSKKINKLMNGKKIKTLNITHYNNFQMNNEENIINKKQNPIIAILKFISKIFTPFFTSAILFIILILLVDYKTIESKINEPYKLKQKEIETEYEINKCKKNGNLPRLKPICEKMLNEIEILKNKKPSIISIISFGIVDIINSIIENYGIINSSIIFSFLILIYIIYKLI